LIASKFTALAIAAGLVLGTSGCGLMSPIDSRIEYAPADGTQVDLETLKLRNFMYLTDGTVSAIAGSVVNPGLESKTLKISYTDAAVNEMKVVTISVNAGQKLDLGFNGTRALAINLGGSAGGVVNITVSEGMSEEVMNVPVLDNTFDFYQPIIDSLKLVEPSAQ
jgi:hypothetical protein